MPEPTDWSTHFQFVASEAVCILKLTGRSSLRSFLVLAVERLGWMVVSCDDVADKGSAGV
jgi:hypothetical protein